MQRYTPPQTTADANDARFAHRFLHSAAITYPHSIVVISLALALLGGYVYFFELRIISERKQLINQDLEINQRYLQYIDEFGDNEIVVLVVQADSSNRSNEASSRFESKQREHMKRVASAWAAQLRQRPNLFPAVYERINWPAQNGLPLLYLPYSEVQHIAAVVTRNRDYIRQLATDPSLKNQLNVINTITANLGTAAPSAADSSLAPVLLNSLQLYLQRLSEIVQNEDGETGELQFGETAQLFSKYSGRFDPEGFFFSENGRIMTAYAHVNGNPAQRNRYSNAMHYARQALSIALASDSVADDLDAGIAGMPALEYEEIATTQSDFARGALLALVGVTALFMFAFGHIVRPALAALALCCAIGMTFVFAWLVLGHLSLLAMIFTIILVALGIDFAIHFLTHYEQALKNGHAPAQAIVIIKRTIGGPLWLGGLTTAAAFLSAGLTEFVGLAELGIIAGAGLLFCLLCMYFMFPAMLFLVDTHFQQLGQKIGVARRQDFFRNVALSFTAAQQGRALLIMLVIIASGYAFGQYELDKNLLRLQAADGEASHWQQVLLKNDDRSLFAISTSETRAALDAMRTKLMAKPETVRHTESAYPLFETEKRAALAGVCSTFSQLSIGPPEAVSLTDIKRQLWNLRQTVRKLRRKSPQAASALTGLEETATRFYKDLTSGNAGDITARLTALQDATRNKLTLALQRHDEVFCPPDLSRADLPPILRDRFISDSGKLAMFIYPAKNTWEQDNLAEFVRALRQVDPQVMGELVSLYENGNSLARSFMAASIYALAAILALLLISTRSAKATALMLIPLVSGVGLLLAFMRLWPGEIVWNFTNFFALPILIGISVDSGIHLVRAWRSSVAGTYAGAVTAVILSSLTTIIGFGVLATSSHLGVRSLGLVLFLGITFILLSSLTVLPIALRLSK